MDTAPIPAWWAHAHDPFTLLQIRLNHEREIARAQAFIAWASEENDAISAHLSDLERP